MVNHPNRNRLSTTKKLRVQFDYQEGWYWDHPGEPDYTALIKWPPGKTLREAIAPRCRELGVDAATAASTMVTRTWHLGEDVKRNLSYVRLYIGTEEQRGVIMRRPRRTKEQREKEKADWDRRVAELEAWAVAIEQGLMRQAEYRHFPLDEDTSENPIIYGVTVPYLALVLAEDPAVPGRQPHPIRVIGRQANGVPQLQSLREFCTEHNIRFRDCHWSASQRKFELSHRVNRDKYGGSVRILVFDTVEDQRAVASAFPGRLR